MKNEKKYNVIRYGAVVFSGTMHECESYCDGYEGSRPILEHVCTIKPADGDEVVNLL